MESQSNQDHGSFPTGLIVGFLAGAVGYFLTQTKEGREMREKFAGHWQGLRESMIAEGKLSEDECEITDYIRAARSKISDFLREAGYTEETNKKTNRKKPSKSKKRIFKGI